MFLYELAVDERARRRGIGRALVERLATLARAQGCYGMWVLTDDTNEAARATYEGTGALPQTGQVVEVWTFYASRPWASGLGLQLVHRGSTESLLAPEAGERVVVVRRHLHVPRPRGTAAARAPAWARCRGGPLA